jgi:hypothetical protein
MLFAPPMISQDDIFFTKLLSISIFEIEYAKEIMTAKGRPSGTATTIMVIPTI